MIKAKGKVFNCTVNQHDYAKLIEQDVEVLSKDILGDGEWVLVVYKDIPYVVNNADIDIKD